MVENKLKLTLDTLGIHPSNIVPYLLGSWLLLHYGLPLLDSVFGVQELAGQNNVEIMEIKAQNKKILEENEKLRKEVMSQRKSGVKGYTRFGANYDRS